MKPDCSAQRQRLQPSTLYLSSGPAHCLLGMEDGANKDQNRCQETCVHLPNCVPLSRGHKYSSALCGKTASLGERGWGSLVWHMSVSPSHLATHIPSNLSNYLVRTWALILMKDFSISFPANVSRKQTQKESQVGPALTLRLQRSPFFFLWNLLNLWGFGSLLVGLLPSLT